jgi:hypothetical protein
VKSNKVHFVTRRQVILLAATVILAFTGCMNPTVTNSVRRLNRDAERSGSPYRYRAYRVAGGTTVEKYRVIPPSPIPIPTDLRPTSANTELQRDIVAKIAIIQQGWSSTGGPSLLGVKPLAASGGSIKELWFVKEGEGAIRYEVTMTPSAQGGTDFSVRGPVD